MKYRTYPVCARCSIVMDPNLYDDVTPGFVINGEVYCPDCFREWVKDEVDDCPECVAQAMNILVRGI